MLPLLLKVSLLHVRWQTGLAHVAISHGSELRRVHIHIHGHSVGSHVAVTHMLSHELSMLEGSVVL